MTCRHVTERISRVQGPAVILDVAIILSGQEQNAELIQQGFALTAGLAIPSYSRKQEAEADRVGLMYMAKAGFDPRAAPRIWRRAAEKRNAASIFSTHPSSTQRYRELEKLLPQALEAYRKATGRPHFSPER